jgi:hypothetical protein
MSKSLLLLPYLTVFNLHSNLGPLALMLSSAMGYTDNNADLNILMEDTNVLKIDLTILIVEKIKFEQHMLHTTVVNVT